MDLRDSVQAPSVTFYERLGEFFAAVKKFLVDQRWPAPKVNR